MYSTRSDLPCIKWCGLVQRNIIAQFGSEYLFVVEINLQEKTKLWFNLITVLRREEKDFCAA